VPRSAPAVPVATRAPAPPPWKPVYLGQGAPVFGVLHPAAAAGADVAVLVCPPFGWEHVRSYRSLRTWACELAAAGRPALRIDLPCTGDSAGTPLDDDVFGSWLGAVGRGARWLSEATAAERVVAIGIGLGGLIAARAQAEGAPIDDLVLWSVPARGRTIVRQMRAFEGMQRATPIDTEPSDLPDGFVEAAGFVLNAETAAAIADTDLTAVPFDGAARRVLLLERDGLPVDRRLARHYQDAGAHVTVAPGAGYAAMMAAPEEAVAPREAFRAVDAWLGQARSPGPIASRGGAPHDGEAELAVEGGARIRESLLTIEQPFGRLFGVLAEPVDAPPAGVCAVLLNAGGIHRIGPSRLWVELARRWAAKGVATLRLDVEGIGDADGDATRYHAPASFYDAALLEQVLASLDALEARGLPARFALMGLCAGATWSFQAALHDPRVVAALMINLWSFSWDSSLQVQHDASRTRELLRAAAWRRLVRGEIRPRRAASFARSQLVALRQLPHRARIEAERGEGIDELLDRLRDLDKRGVLVFNDGEYAYEEFERSGRLDRLDRWPNLRIERIAGRDHTLAPLVAQRRVNELLDRAIEREVGLAGV